MKTLTLILVTILLFSCENEKEVNKNIKRYNDASAAFKSGNYSGAMAFFEAIISSGDNKNLLEAHVGLGWAKIRSNSFDTDTVVTNARKSFDSALLLSAGDEAAKFGLVQLNYIAKTGLSTALTYTGDILADDTFSFALDAKLNKNHVLYHKALIQFYKKSYSDCKTTVESLASNLSHTLPALNVGSSDFITKLGNAINSLKSSL